MLFFITLVLIISWYKDGFIYAGGDIGFPTYNPTNAFNIARYVWWSKQGTGYTYPAIVSSVPIYFALMLVQQLRLGPLSHQAFFFFVNIFLALSGTYLLLSFYTKKRYLSVLGAIYYVFSPYTMLNIFHRSTHTGMVMLAFIPWTLLLLKLGFERKSLNYALLLSAVSIIGAYAFGTVAFMATWWFLVFFYWIFSIEKKYLKFYLIFLLVLLFSWIVVHSWWLITFFNSAYQSLSISTTFSGNLNSLKGVSQYFKMPSAFRGINEFYLYSSKDFSATYQDWPIMLISWTGFFFIVYSIFAKTKGALYKFSWCLFVITIFISKGTTQPFGELIAIAFKLLPAIGVFRNPYEKFGILIPIASVYLFVLGFHAFTKTKSKKAFASVVLFIFFGYYLKPIWTGDVFGNYQSDLKVKVPTYYDEASKWIDDNSDDNVRILHLPFVLSDGVIYSWEHGYHGLESSDLFFPGSNISHLLGYELVDKQYTNLAKSVSKNNQEKFSSYLNNFSVQYIVVHKDIDFNWYRGININNIVSFLDANDNVTFEKEFGQLLVYRNNSPNLLDKIYTVQYPSFVSGNLIEEGSYYSPTEKMETYIHVNNPEKSDYVFPTALIDYPEGKTNFERAVDEMPFARYLPDSPLYPLVKQKEKVNLMLYIEEGQLYFAVDLLSKRLVELNSLLGKGNQNYNQMIIAEYVKGLDQLKPTITDRVSSAAFNNEKQIISSYQYKFLRQEQALINYILPMVAEKDKYIVNDAIQKLKDFGRETGLFKIYEISEGTGQISRFKINGEDTYNINLIGGTKNNLRFFVNGDIKFGYDTSISGQDVVEIAIPYEEEEIISISEIRLSAQDKPYVTDFDYIPVDENKEYLISFNYVTNTGAYPRFTVLEDSNSVDEDGIQVKSADVILGANNHNYGVKRYSLIFRPKPLSNNFKIEFELKPLNNCLEINWDKKWVCDQENVYTRYNQSSESLISDLTISTTSEGDVYLNKVNKNVPQGAKNIFFERISPIEYSVYLAQDSPKYLIFNESYHGGWALKDSTGKILTAEHFVVNGYANAWDISDISKNQEIKIVFLPQSNLKNAMILATVFGILTIFFVYKFR